MQKGTILLLDKDEKIPILEIAKYDFVGRFNKDNTLTIIKSRYVIKKG